MSQWTSKASDNPLVSVVIPCYNAERWVGEAVDSCLGQTYQPMEIIVIDDGSTDRSHDILCLYRDKIHLERGPNRGGNSARNQGFALSQGEYIQFLDADDYLLPEKIERQVAFLEKAGGDVVFGDWQHRFHEPDGSSHLSDVQVAGQQADVLESLLAGWWVAPVAMLWRRRIVEASGGWDATLSAGQDRDFFISAAVCGADIRYHPGCYSVYRRHGSEAVAAWKHVGSANHMRWLESHRRIMEKAEEQLVASGQLLPIYQRALANSVFRLARNYYDIDRIAYGELLEKALYLCPGFEPQESRLYSAVWRFLGFAAADRLASYKRRISRGMGAASGPVRKHGGG